MVYSHRSIATSIAKSSKKDCTVSWDSNYKILKVRAPIRKLVIEKLGSENKEPAMEKKLFSDNACALTKRFMH